MVLVTVIGDDSSESDCDGIVTAATKSGFSGGGDGVCIGDDSDGCGAACEDDGRGGFGDAGVVVMVVRVIVLR